MLASARPALSSYLEASDFQQLRTTTDGNYGGLGLSVTMEDGTVKVIARPRTRRRWRAGIKAGDYITHIDGELLYGLELDEAVEKMRGLRAADQADHRPPGRDKPFDVTLVRERIELRPVKWEIKDGVGVININTFSANVGEQDQGGADWRSTRRPAASRSAMSSTCAPTRAGCSTRRSRSATPSWSAARSCPSAAAPRTTSSASMRGPATWPAACRSSCWSMPAAPRRPRSSPARCRTTAAPSSWASELRQGLGPDRRSRLGPGKRAAADHGALLHAVGPLGAGRRDRSRHRRAAAQRPRLQGRPRVREADLRRHLISQNKVDDKLLEKDERADPRFSMTAAELEKKGIKDFQLDYAVKTLKRLARGPSAGGSPRRADGCTAARSLPARLRATAPRGGLAGSRCWCRAGCSAARSARNISAGSTRARCATGSAGRTGRRWRLAASPSSLRGAARALLTLLAALAIAVSGAIGVFHAGRRARLVGRAHHLHHIATRAAPDELLKSSWRPR
jgi:carboxyl-terminal processing protease